MLLEGLSVPPIRLDPLVLHVGQVVFNVMQNTKCCML